MTLSNQNERYTRCCIRITVIPGRGSHWIGDLTDISSSGYCTSGVSGNVKSLSAGAAKYSIGL